MGAVATPTRVEMITYLKKHFPAVCNHTKIDSLPDVCGPEGGNTVHKIYIDCHGGPTNWESLQASEQRVFLDCTVMVYMAFSTATGDKRAPVFFTGIMSGGWVYAKGRKSDGKLLRMGISSGGVLSIGGDPVIRTGEHRMKIAAGEQALITAKLQEAGVHQPE